MNPSEAVRLIIAELRTREIHAMRSSPRPGSPTTALSISAAAAQRFLDAMVPAPLDADDDLTRHLVGRP